MTELSRREFVTRAAAGVTVVGFAAGRWVTAGEPAQAMAAVPTLDGTLVMDSQTLADNAHDEGNIVQQTPWAVLYPGPRDPVGDIQKMIVYCGQNGIKVATNTGRNSVFGQTLVSGGLVINGKSLNTIHSITPQGADVDAGVLVMDLIKAAVPGGLTLATVTGYTQLGFGGLVAMGGFDAIASNLRPSLVDQVQALQVVTGAGDVVWCSPTSSPELFSAMLAGQGQCGVITRVVVNMVPAPQFARFYRAPYADIPTFFSDIRMLLTRSGQPGGFDWVASVNQAGLIGLVDLWATRFYNPDSPPPPVTTLMSGCSATAHAAAPLDLPYLDYVFLVDTLVDSWRAGLNWDDLVKPWFNVILPDSGVEAFVQSLFPKLTPADVSLTTFVLLMPILRSAVTRPLFRVPSSGTWAWVLGILTNSAQPGHDPAFATAMTARNYGWWQNAAAIGGTRYPEDAVPFTPADWQTHYGPTVYAQFAAWKKQFDPRGILTPGPAIF